MTEELTEQVFNGTPASGDVVIGLTVHYRQNNLRLRQSGTANEERDVLQQALSDAKNQLIQLSADQSELARDILEFQIALIEDEDLIEPVMQKIEGGVSADTAWCEALDNEIADYKGIGDDYMAARADDLADLKHRVLSTIHDTSGPQADLTIDNSAPPDGAILIAKILTPSAFLEQDWASLAGAALAEGSPTSHVSILARARGVNLIVGLKADLNAVPNGTRAILDAGNGTLTCHPSSQMIEQAKRQISDRQNTIAEANRLLEEPARTLDGQHVNVYLNVDDPDILKTLSPEICDGVGLTRTEFLFDDERQPDEEAQLAIYRSIVGWAAGRPVTLRTLDAGGDKPITGITIDGESNPFLGVRGVRLSLLNKPLLNIQLRAMARAAAHGPVKILIPMVTVPQEMYQVRILLDNVLDELRNNDVAHGTPQLGMMVEVPAAALSAQLFDTEFYSIGSNDLIQYTTAAARDNSALTELADPANPAVYELIRLTVETGRQRGTEVSLCGDMASIPKHIHALLDTGLRTLSVAPAQIGLVKQAIGKYQSARRPA